MPHIADIYQPVHHHQIIIIPHNSFIILVNIHLFPGKFMFMLYQDKITMIF